MPDNIVAVDPEIEFAEENPPYTLVFNQLIFDDRLRWQTRGLMIAMLSRPKDWDFSVRGMAKIAKVSKDTMAKAICELETAGYIKRKVQTRKSGRFGKAGFIVSGRPIFETKSNGQLPCPNLPGTVSSDPISSPQLNKEQPSKEQEEKKQTKKSPAESDMLFNRFWAAYPRKKGKQDAMSAWAKLNPDIALCRVMSAALKWQKQSEQWQSEGGQYIPYPAKWLRKRLWEDEPDELPAKSGAYNEEGEDGI